MEVLNCCEWLPIHFACPFLLLAESLDLFFYRLLWEIRFHVVLRVLTLIINSGFSIGLTLWWFALGCFPLGVSPVSSSYRPTTPRNKRANLLLISGIHYVNNALEGIVPGVSMYYLVAPAL